MLACILAIGKVMPSLLIYKGSNGDLQTSWLEDVREDSGTYFTSSDNGCSSKQIRLRWLAEIFERYIKPSALRAKRLLIVSSSLLRRYVYKCYVIDLEITSSEGPTLTHNSLYLMISYLRPLSNYENHSNIKPYLRR